MKFSIIFGVFHMLLGILLKGLNSILEFKLMKLIGVVIPEFIFMSCSFGYMCFCIIYKWF